MVEITLCTKLGHQIQNTVSSYIFLHEIVIIYDLQQIYDIFNDYTAFVHNLDPAL